MPKAYALLLAAAFSSALVAAAPAFAASQHDGTWSVSLVTKAGDCDPSVSSSITVRQGRVNENLLVARIVGGVNSNGAVSLQVVRGSDSMNARGKISGTVASGSWTAPTKNCSGSWTAVRA